MTDEQLAELERLEQAATPGPWEAYDGDVNGPRVETVGAWWHWHETRPEWRRLGYSKRRMRK